MKICALAVKAELKNQLVNQFFMGFFMNFFTNTYIQILYNNLYVNILGKRDTEMLKFHLLLQPLDAQCLRLYLAYHLVC